MDPSPLERSAEAAWTFVQEIAARARALEVKELAVGGSFGDGSARESSDLDLFLVVRDLELARLLALDVELPTRLLPSGARLGEPRFVPGYGIGVNAQVHLRPRIDLFFVGSFVQLNDHRRKNQLVFGEGELIRGSHSPLRAPDPTLDIEVLVERAELSLSKDDNFDAMYRLSRAVVLQLSRTTSRDTLSGLDDDQAIIDATHVLRNRFS